MHTSLRRETVGEPQVMTMKEMKLANIPLEKEFTRKLNKKTGPRPRLSYWDLVPMPAKPEKKLGEQ